MTTRLWCSFLERTARLKRTVNLKKAQELQKEVKELGVIFQKAQSSAK